MSLTRSKKRSKYRYKVGVWGPQNAGKSHYLFSARKVGAVDYENRGGAFDALFDFASDVPKTIQDAERIMADIAANPEFETIGYDSLSIPYEYYVGLYTTRGDKGESTNFAMVNRHMSRHLAQLVAVRDKFVIATIRQTVAYEQNGNYLKRAGVKMIGDEVRWPYAFDYFLHFSGRGAVHVEKSMVPHLPVGTNIHEDLDFEAFDKLIEGEYRLDGHGHILLPKPTQAGKTAAAPVAAPQPTPEPEPQAEEPKAKPEQPKAKPVEHDSETPLQYDPLADLSERPRKAMEAFIRSRGIDPLAPTNFAYIRTAIVEASDGNAEVLDDSLVPAFKATLLRKTQAGAA